MASRKAHLLRLHTHRSSPVTRAVLSAAAVLRREKQSCLRDWRATNPRLFACKKSANAPTNRGTATSRCSADAPTDPDRTSIPIEKAPVFRNENIAESFVLTGRCLSFYVIRNNWLQACV